MSLTNQQRTKLLNTITGADVRVLAMSTSILDKLHLKEYMPPAVLELLHRHVDTYYIFRDNYKTGVYDGLSTRYVYTDHDETITALGLGDTALNEPVSYQVFLVLHELSHLVTHEAEHTAFFHSYLDMLILKTNEYSGLNIENDYCQ